LTGGVEVDIIGGFVILRQGAINKARSATREGNNHPHNLSVKHKPLEDRIAVLDMINPMCNCRGTITCSGGRGERRWQFIQVGIVPLVTEMNHSLDIFGRHDFTEDNEPVVIKEPFFVRC